MSYIVLECSQSGYRLITVPQRIADDAYRYQMEFDKWLMDPTSDHGYWHMEPEWDEPILCYDPPTAFVEWLNDTVLPGSEQAEVIGDEWPLLHF